MKYIWLLLLAGCASQMTEADLVYKQYEEQERVIAYRLWEQACINAGGAIYVSNPFRRCYRKDCVPHEADWSQYRKLNNVQCVKLR